MSGEGNNDNANIMELMKSLFSSMIEQFNSNINDMNHNINNNMNSIRDDMSSIKDDMNSNNDMVNARFESLQERIASRAGSRAVNRLNGSLQAEGIATREELLARIDTKSRMSCKASSRATSPHQVAARLQELSEKLPEHKMPLETPRMEYSDVPVSMTEIFANKQAADDFEEVNRLRDKRRPMVNKRDNTISSRETFAAINRPGNPVMKETFSRTIPNNKAHLSSPLTLEKCLTFERFPAEVQSRSAIYQLR